MRIQRRFPATSGQVSAGGGVTSGVYQGSGGLYFTLGDVGSVSEHVNVGLNARSANLVGNRVVSLRWYTPIDDSNLRNNQVRVEVHNTTPLASGGSSVELGSGTSISGAFFTIDAEAEL